MLTWKRTKDIFFLDNMILQLGLQRLPLRKVVLSDNKTNNEANLSCERKMLYIINSTLR